MLRYFVCFSILLCSSSWAQEIKLPNVAVMPFSGDKTVTPEQLSFISSKFTGELILTGAFSVLDRGKMDYILKEQGFQQSGACNSSDCQVQMGQLLGVDNLVTGSLVRFGSTYALHIEYINVSSGRIEKTVDTEQKGDLEDTYKFLCYTAANQLSEVSTVSSAEGKGKKRVVPADAIPSLERPMSLKRKIAIALWASALGGAGGGFYFNKQGSAYESDYEKAISQKDTEATKEAFDETQKADLYRNVSYSVSVTGLIAGAVLWFLPEAK